ncbi:MAG: calcium/sodium antiporter [Parvularculaceae bacterium]
MVEHVALLIVGLALLLASGDLLVRGAVGLATAQRVPTLIVGLTIVAFGTSAPELVVSVQSVLAGAPGIALGNVIGSNIANVLLVLGFPAVIFPIAAQAHGLKLHTSVMLAATAAFAAVAYLFGAITLAIGTALFAAIVGYVVYTGARGKNREEPSMVDDVAEFGQSDRLTPRILFFLAIGLVGLPVGAHLLVDHGGQLAAALGVRDEIIGLTIVAFGTSLPELATVVAAAMHRKSDVALGNIIGSNIFNLLAVGGAIGLAGGARFDAATLRFDLPIMAAVAILISAFVYAKRDIGRLSGLAMGLAYLAFIIALAAKST